MDKTLAQDLTDDVIDNASTEELRQMALDHDLGLHERRMTVLDVTITPELVQHVGALTALDQCLRAVKEAHKDLEPLVQSRYGAAYEVTCWRTDDNLRHALKWARNRALQSS